MNQLNSGVCDKSGLNMDPENRCSKIIEDSKKLGVETVIGGRDIQSVGTFCFQYLKSARLILNSILSSAHCFSTPVLG